MPWGALAAGIAATAAAANTYYSGVNASDLNRANRNWQEHMMQRQREWAIEDFERENDISAWSQRVQQAGLNPALLAGQSDLTTPSSAMRGVSPNASSPYQHMPAFDSQGFAQAAQMLMQDRLVNAQSKAANSQSISSVIDAAIKAYEIGGEKLYNSVLQVAAPSLNGSSSPDDSWIAKRIKSQIYNIDMDSLNKDLQYNLSKKYSPEQISTGIAKANQDISESVARLQTMHFQNEVAAKKLGKELALMVAQAFHLIAEGNRANADVKTINAVRDFTVGAAKAQMRLQENEAYKSDVYRENFKDAADYLQGSVGKKSTLNRIMLDDIGSSNPFLRAIDYTFDTLNPLKIQFPVK